MNKSYSIAQARAALPAIVDEADAGPVEITRRGKPVAVVLSLTDYERLRSTRPTFSEAYARFLDGVDLTTLGLDEDLTTRDPSPGRRVDL